MLEWETNNSSLHVVREETNRVLIRQRGCLRYGSTGKMCLASTFKQHNVCWLLHQKDNHMSQLWLQVTVRVCLGLKEHRHHFVIRAMANCLINS